MNYFADNDRIKDKEIRKLKARNEALKQTIDDLEATNRRLERKKNKRMRTNDTTL